MPNSGIAPSTKMKRMLNHIFQFYRFYIFSTLAGDVLEDRIFSFSISNIITFLTGIISFT